MGKVPKKKCENKTKKHSPWSLFQVKTSVFGDLRPSQPKRVSFYILYIFERRRVNPDNINIRWQITKFGNSLRIHIFYAMLNATIYFVSHNNSTCTLVVYVVYKSANTVYSHAPRSLRVLYNI